jgi:DNA sulfur modification protein DndC
MSELPILGAQPPEVDLPSVFDSRTHEDLYQEIRDAYCLDERPWIIGYSGGKDSTTALQLIWMALRGLDRAELTKPVYVISSDTMVETPVIVNYITTTLERINEAAAAEGLPIEASKVSPTVEEGFWVNLIGKGYPAPSTRFRWCTERLKINPANRFILERVGEFGEVIVVLGVRKGESATRDQVMNLHRIPGDRLSRHTSLPNAFVYTPIEDFSVRDVWTYLIEVDSPWGNDNQDLVDLYRSAQSDECPLVIDKTTPSCGNSRFGCWVCTVVTKDTSMESMIASGEEWLLPFLEFRDFLASTQLPEDKLRYRDYRRMDGKVWGNRGDGSVVPGPYTLETSRTMLRHVLEIHRHALESGPDGGGEVVREDELREIRRIWRTERQDWEDSVPKIYREVFGEDLEWLVDDTGTFGARERVLLEEACGPHDVPSEMLAKLLDVERDMMGMSRRATIFSKIDRVLKQEWRTLEEVLESMPESEEGTL